MQLENKGCRLALKDPQEEFHAPIIQFSVDWIWIGLCASWQTAFWKIAANFLAHLLLVKDLLVKKAWLNDFGHVARVGAENEEVTTAVIWAWLIKLPSQSCLAARIADERRKWRDFLGQQFLSSARMATWLISAVLELSLPYVKRGTDWPLTVAEVLISDVWLEVACWICLKVAEQLIIVVRREGVIDFWPVTLSYNNTTRREERVMSWWDSQLKCIHSWGIHYLLIIKSSADVRHCDEDRSNGTYLSAEEWVHGSADSCPNLSCLHSLLYACCDCWQTM